MTRSLLLLFISFSLFIGCAEEEDLLGSESMALQLAEVMTAIDDSGGDTGSYAFMQKEIHKTQKLYPKHFYAKSSLSLIPKAHAVACSSASTFSGCTNNVITRDFQNCTIGSVSLSGSVSYTFNDALTDNTCSLASAGHSVTRDPDFEIRGPLGATYSVSRTGSFGQRVTLTSTPGEFEFTNDGLRRALSLEGVTLSDWSSSTSSAISVSGSSRTGRVADGGVLEVTNNLSGVTCDFVPSNVTWGASCNCATSGSWSATCSDGATVSYQVTGCDSGTLITNGTAEQVALNICN